MRILVRVQCSQVLIRRPITHNYKDWVYSVLKTSHLKYQWTKLITPQNIEDTYYQGLPRNISPHLHHSYLDKNYIQTRDIYKDI